MKNFGIFSGLLLNLGKCGIVVKGRLHPGEQKLVVQASPGDTFLGISPKACQMPQGTCRQHRDEVYVIPLGEAQRRAEVVALLPLSLKERLVFLKT